MLEDLFKRFKREPAHQLVLESHGDSHAEFERVIITKTPQRCFEETMCHVAVEELQSEVACFCKLHGVDYTRIWPLGDMTPFDLKYNT